MKKYLYLIFVSILLAACGSNEGVNTNENVEPDNGDAYQESEEVDVTMDWLADRVEGMSYDQYNSEIRAWEEQGEAEILETVPLEDGNKGQIIQVKDGFVAVAHDQQSVVDVIPSISAEDAKDQLES
ncbi:hypothetical protein [Mesobacillus harenae]|uniref:hypothetical protein n=1 Tax=Mesobacillus harenae TaxID=2213203 RepID=UPI00158101D1|nr:hypothetical protein [Mesobacillus harenae]